VITRPNRRQFVRQAAGTVAGGLGALMLLDCDSSSTPASPSQGTGTTGKSTATTGTIAQVPDSGFVRIPANPAFAFATTLANTGTGESSPIASDYCMGINLVTNVQFQAFSGKSFPAGRGDHPVLWVSASSAQAYCDWLTQKLTGWTVRLPSEAEWENAARGPNRYTYPWGNSMDAAYGGGTLSTKFNYNGVCAAAYLANHGSDLAIYNQMNSPLYGTRAAISAILSISASGSVGGWIDHNNSAGFVYTDVFDALVSDGGFTTPVGSYPAGVSGYGCHDMAGNAFEWTSSQIVAQNGAEAGRLVNAVRGGSWYSVGTSGKTSYRGEGRAPDGAYHSVGFRVAAAPR
jgi:formylglycine-generating enzyme required for sulfatase activity